MNHRYEPNNYHTLHFELPPAAVFLVALPLLLALVSGLEVV